MCMYRECFVRVDVCVIVMVTSDGWLRMAEEGEGTIVKSDDRRLMYFFSHCLRATAHTSPPLPFR